jgi:cobalt-zinc-cadmium efflux system outer membrane protein
LASTLGRFSFAASGEAANLAKEKATLGWLLGEVRKRHPLLVAAREKVSGFQRIVEVSGAWPNPQLSYQREQLFPPINQDTVGLGVFVPLGGRTFRKKEVAKKSLESQKAYVQLLWFRIRQRFLRMFFEWIALRDQVVLAENLMKRFGQFKSLLRGRVQGGQAAGLALLRFEIEMEQQAHKLRRDKEKSSLLLNRLALWTGLEKKRFLALQFSLFPEQKSIKKIFDQGKHIDLRYDRYQIAVVEAELRFAQAKAWPDLSVSISYLYQRSSLSGQADGHGFVAGITLPLPIFERNQENIQRARERLNLAKKAFLHRKQIFQKKAVYAQKRFQSMQKRWMEYQKGVSERLPQLLQGAQAAFLGGGSFSNFFETYRAIERYNRFGVALKHDVRTCLLDVEEMYGYVLF